jgi:PAS domain S-box-containing protein
MPGNILIVDDHEIVRRGLRSLLSARPEWQICGEAEDGLQGVERAKALRPSLVLMDISMPRMNGLEATRILRRDLPETKVVIISQNDPAIARRQAKEVDAAAYISKSDLSRDLLPTLSSFLGHTDSCDGITPTQPVSSPPVLDWLAGGGILSRLIQEHDFSKTPLGPIAGWPQSLKTSVNLILNSQHPMWIGWGPEATFLYNDAYVQVLSSAKHPRALGRPTAEVWPEIWDICGPLADKVFQNGEASFVDEVRLFMNRGDFLEETYYSFSYSPIRDESGNVAGLFCPSTEVTPKVINARRLRTLSQLSAHALVQKTTSAACESAVATLASNTDDVPFAILYLLEDEHTARLERHCGLLDGRDDLSPLVVDLTGTGQPCLWPLAEVVKTGQGQVISLADEAGLPRGLAQQTISEAMVLPVTSRGDDGAVGVLVAGVNPARKLDAEYHTFYELIAGQIATAIQNARAAEEERKRLESLAEIDRAKTAFFSNVSHEFRTPLTLMLGPVEDLLAKSYTGLSPAAKSQLELVNRNGSRLLRLVNTLLDFSRIEAGRMQAIYLPTDLAAFTVELASVFRSATEKAGLQLELDCPQFDEPVFVDRGMWEKVVLNLISNAFKFTFEGSIAVSLTKSGSDAELRVRDTGVGIPSKELPRLFDRFHRIESTRSRTHEGSGIGLALVHELVKLHGGSVRVESELGEGSTFIVSLPLGSAHLPADRIGGNRTLATTALGAAPFVEEALRWLPDTAASDVAQEISLADELLPVPCPPLSNGKAASENRPRILIADDNADMRQYLVRLLSERYEVHAVPDGQAALASVRTLSPELVLSDVMMPNLDGFGLLNALRSDPATRTVPIILLSASAGEESRVEGMEHGADDYLIKPFSARELLARVQTHLEMARIRKQAEEDLRRRTEQFETLLNEAPLGVYLVDADFRVRAVNPPALSAFVNIPNLIGTDFEGFMRMRWPQEYADEILNRFRHTLETGEPYIVSEWNRWGSQDGDRTTYEWQINRIPLPEGGYGVVCYFRDITDRKRIEERERQMAAEAVAATAKFRAVFEQTPVFAGIMALDGTIMDANQLCLEACGYRAEDVLGRLFWETGWWRRSKDVQDKVRAATLQAAQGTPYRENLTYHWADDTERLVDFAVHPIRDDQGKILFLHPTGVDITDLKRAEEKYRTLAESLDAEVRIRTTEVVQQAEQLRDLSSRLLQAQDEERRHIARELHDSAGQILTALSMSLALASQHAPQESAALTKHLEESEDLAQQLSQEIRTMSYLLHPPLLDETGLSEALRWYIQGLSERSGLEIELDVPTDFARLSREMELVMFRLVQESLTNIHRHSGSKSAAIRLARNGDSVSLEVQDSGKGISAEKLSEIQSQGSGVGIRGMRERARHFGGHMMIESNHKGTKISFQFPLSENSPAQPNETSDQENSNEPTPIIG